MAVMEIQRTTTTATGAPKGGTDAAFAKERVFQATVAGTGAVGATVKIYGSLTDLSSGAGTNGVLLGTITLSGTTTATDGFSSVAPWRYVWSDVTAISGTGAEVVAMMGV